MTTVIPVSNRRVVWTPLLSSLLAVALGLMGCATESSLEERTAAEHMADQPVASPAATTAPAQQVESQVVVYAVQNGVEITGWLAYPVGTSGESLPALIVIHEWWGLNDNVRATAERLAAEGYVTLAVDLYNGQVGTTVKAAMGLMYGLSDTEEAGRENLVAAYAYLSDVVGAEKIGVIGWCLGGKWSLQAALRMPDQIDAAVIYYGSVTDDKAQLETLQMPILGLFAGIDPVVPPDTVVAFQEALNELGKDADITIYPTAKHAFANPSGMSYDAEAAEDAWGKTITFLAENLQ